MHLLSFRVLRFGVGFRVFGGILTYIAYLDEFGHDGPFVSRFDPHHKTSPVFGLAGYVIPLDEVRNFGTWFYQRKCELLAYEIKQSKEHPATWEKKGSSLYTVGNIKKYRELRKTTFRILSRINKIDGFVFYCGIEKTMSPSAHNPNKMYESVLREVIKRLNQHCHSSSSHDNFLLALDEHQQRTQLTITATRQMYNPAAPRRHLIEQPFYLKSHLSQTIQAADWIAGLVGRLGAYWIKPEEYKEFEIFNRYFEYRIKQLSQCSHIRSDEY